MERHPQLRLIRMLLAIFAAATLAGQILEVEQATQMPHMAMTLRDSRVISVPAGGAADRAGIRPGDQIVAVGGQAISRAYDPLVLLKRLRSGVETTVGVEHGGVCSELPYRPEAPDRMDILWRFAVAVVGIVTLLIGTLVFLKRPRPLTLTFGAICYAMGYLVHPPLALPVASLLIGRKLVLIASTLLLPPLLVHLFLRFPLRQPLLERRGRRIGLLYAPSLVLFGFSSAAFAAVSPRALDGHWSSLVVRASATLLWIAGIAAAITLFVRAYRHASTRTSRRKVRVILWGTILGTLPVAVLLLLREIRPGLEFPGDRLAVLAMILIPLSFGYAIVRHGIFDLTLIVRRSLAFSLLAALLVLAYFALQMSLRGLLVDLTRVSPLLVSFLSLFGVGLLLLPAYRGLQQLLENRDGSARREQADLLYGFAAALRGVLERGALVRLISESLAEALGANRVAYFEVSRTGALTARYLCGLPSERVAPLHLSAALSRQLARVGGAVDRGDLDTELPFGYLAPSDQAVLDALDARLLVPLRATADLKGFVVVGEPAYGEDFSPEDLRIAETIAAEGSLALQNSALQERALEEERLRRDVDLARDLQERLLPAHLPQVESLELTGLSIPCRGVGGDYYDCFATASGELVLAIGDVSGKGVPGAILMANLQGVLKVEGLRDEPPAEIVGRINRRLCEIEKPERFVTFCLARIDPRTGRFAYCNAGHPSPLLVRSDGRIEELTRGGLPLGIGADAHYEGAESRLRSGDVLLFYTDGITERTRPEGEEFGKERLDALVRSGRRLSARALQQSILGEVQEFSPTPLDDDTTLLLLKML
jgi:phosphoserine phosphatase RsbU/P